MASLTQNRNTRQMGDRSIPDLVQVGVAASTLLLQGALVAINGSGGVNAGFLQKVVAPVPAGGLVVVGRTSRRYDNTGTGTNAGDGNGIAGNLIANVLQGTFPWDNATGADAVTLLDVGAPCFASDDHTVCRTDSAGTRPFAGIVVFVDPADGQVFVETRSSVRKPGQVLSFALDFASITASQIVSFKPGFRGMIERMDLLIAKPVTTAAKAATLTPRITPSGGSAAAVTGGVISMTSANSTPTGATVAGTTVTAANSFGEQDIIDVTASAVTAFVEGTGTLLIYLA